MTPLDDLSTLAPTTAVAVLTPFVKNDETLHWAGQSRLSSVTGGTCFKLFLLLPSLLMLGDPIFLILSGTSKSSAVAQLILLSVSLGVVFWGYKLSLRLYREIKRSQTTYYGYSPTQLLILESDQLRTYELSELPVLERHADQNGMVSVGYFDRSSVWCPLIPAALSIAEYHTLFALQAATKDLSRWDY